MKADVPEDEEARLQVLAGCGILDTQPEAWFDDIAELAREIAEVPIAFVSLVDRDRQWFKARVGIGIAERQMPRDISFCAHAILSPAPLVVNDTLHDARFADNPTVTGPPNVRFYLGFPLQVDGHAIGTLCMVDVVPREISPKKMTALAALARRVESEVSLRRSTLLESGIQPFGALDPGARVADRYRIEKAIGGGGMGRVYEAHDEKEDRSVAVKVLLTATASEEVIERFAREGRALLKLEDPHVARMFDAGNLDDGTPFLVMELLRGYDLGARPERALSVDEAVSFVTQAARGTAAAHAQGIVHRDLKPSNLFVIEANGEKQVKVLDFGVSKLKEGDDAKGANDPRLTREAAVIGSPLYMAPEQMLSSRGVDARADVWALGVILHELLTGEHPFDGETITEVCSNVFTQQPKPLRAIRPDVPPGLEAVVKRALSFAAPSRYADAGALADALVPWTPPASP